MARREDPKVSALAAVPLFAGMSKRELAAVARLCDEIDLRAGKELIREGEPGRQFFILLEGQADVRRRGRRVNTLAAGDFFGEIALLAARSTTATVTATIPSRVLVLSRANFNKLLRDAPKAQWTIIQALVKRVPGDGILASG